MGSRDLVWLSLVGNDRRLFHGLEQRNPDDGRAIDAGDSRPAALGQGNFKFFAEQIDHPHNPLFAADREPLEQRPANEHRLHPQRDRLDHIGAAPNAAVEEHFQLPPDYGRRESRRWRRRQYSHTQLWVTALWRRLRIRKD